MKVAEEKLKKGNKLTFEEFKLLMGDKKLNLKFKP